MDKKCVMVIDSELPIGFIANTAAELQYLGIAIYGNHKNVKRLTGSLPLLR